MRVQVSALMKIIISIGQGRRHKQRQAVVRRSGKQARAGEVEINTEGKAESEPEETKTMDWLGTIQKLWRLDVLLHEDLVQYLSSLLSNVLIGDRCV